MIIIIPNNHKRECQFACSHAEFLFDYSDGEYRFWTVASAIQNMLNEVYIFSSSYNKSRGSARSRQTQCATMRVKRQNDFVARHNRQANLCWDRLWPHSFIQFLYIILYIFIYMCWNDHIWINFSTVIENVEICEHIFVHIECISSSTKFIQGQGSWTWRSFLLTAKHVCVRYAIKEHETKIQMG